jgi:hypothetical protein
MYFTSISSNTSKVDDVWKSDNVSAPFANLSGSVEYTGKQKSKVRTLAKKLGIDEKESGFICTFDLSKSSSDSNNLTTLQMVNGITGWNFDMDELKEFFWRIDGNNPDWIPEKSRPAHFWKSDLHAIRGGAPHGIIIPPVFVLRFSSDRGVQRWTFEQQKPEKTMSLDTTAVPAWVYSYKSWTAAVISE